MYIAAGEGHTPPGDKIWCQQEPLITSVICCKFQKNLFEVWFNTIFFLMILYMYIAPGLGLTTPWERNFEVNRNILSLRSFVASLKKSSGELIKAYFHFSHNNSMETISCHSDESAWSTAIKNIIFVEANVMNISTKFQLHHLRRRFF